MKTSVILSLLLGILVVALDGCGSPLVKGWHRDQTASASPKAVCLNEGKTWDDADATCRDPNAGSPLTGITNPKDCAAQPGNNVWVERTKQCEEYLKLATPADCALVANKGWDWAAGGDGNQHCLPHVAAVCFAQGKFYDAKLAAPCVDRPILTVPGASATQTLESGTTLTPLSYSVSPVSAQVTISVQTCPSGAFFLLANNQLTSATVDPTWPASTCTATLNAKVGNALSLPVTVTVKIAQGFLSYCNQLSAPGVQDTKYVHIVGVLESIVDTTDCTAAFQKLNEQTTLDLRDEGLIGADLNVIAGFEKLQFLYLQDNVDLEDVSPLKSLPALVLLAMDNTKLNPKVYNSPALRANPATCPVDAATNRAVRDFCLNGDRNGAGGPPVQPLPAPTPVPTATPTPLATPHGTALVP